MRLHTEVVCIVQDVLVEVAILTSIVKFDLLSHYKIVTLANNPLVQRTNPLSLYKEEWPFIPDLHFNHRKRILVVYPGSPDYFRGKYVVLIEAVVHEEASYHPTPCQVVVSG